MQFNRRANDGERNEFEFSVDGPAGVKHELGLGEFSHPAEKFRVAGFDESGIVVVADLHPGLPAEVVPAAKWVDLGPG
jgi:hypothetical protein